MLGLTATVSYGVLSYTFAVFIAPMTQELGWSKATVTGAFSLGSLVAGFAAIPLDRVVDRHGAREVMTAGAMLATVLLIAWSRGNSVAEFYVIWTLMGLATAAVLYEPAFAVIATWFPARRGRAPTVLTFIGGLASVIGRCVELSVAGVLRWRSGVLDVRG